MRAIVLQNPYKNITVYIDEDRKLVYTENIGCERCIKENIDRWILSGVEFSSDSEYIYLKLVALPLDGRYNIRISDEGKRLLERIGIDPEFMLSGTIATILSIIAIFLGFAVFCWIKPDICEKILEPISKVVWAIVPIGAIALGAIIGSLTRR